MKNKFLIPFALFGIILTSCGDSSHPLVGNKFTLTSDAPVETYSEGYTQDTYFALLGGINEQLSTFDKVNTIIKDYFTDGFIKISDTLYESGYIAYTTSSETTIAAIMVPNDNKGIDSESLNIMTSEGHPVYLTSAIGGTTTKSLSCSVYTDTFKKNGDKYEATIDSYYRVNDDEATQITASFVYTFTK